MTALFLTYNYYIGNTSDCTVGFTTEDQLLIASTVPLDSSQLRILPKFPFPCAGQIKNWTIAAILKSGGGRNEYPGLQIWRPNSDPPTSYGNIGEVFFSSPFTTNNNLHSGVLDSPLQFSADDVPGFYVPNSGNGRKGVFSLFLINGYQLLNYVVSPVTTPLPAAITVPPTSMENALPLISLGIGQPHSPLIRITVFEHIKFLTSFLGTTNGYSFRNSI